MRAYLSLLRTSAGLAAILLLGFACTGDRDMPATVSIKPTLNPGILPYRLVVENRIDRPEETELIATDIDSDGKLEAYEVQRERHIVAGHSAVLVCDRPFGDYRAQFNFDRTKITSSAPVDCNSDGSDEIVLLLQQLDSIWIEICDFSGRKIYRRFLATGTDIQKDGAWDGTAAFAGASDLTGDGKPELLIAIDVGWDKHPRQLICIDPASDRVLWRYPVAGSIAWPAKIIRSGNSAEALILFGIASKDNEVQTNGMDDQHSYLICLDAHGNERWRRVTGWKTTNPHLIVSRRMGKIEPDVIFFSYSLDTTAKNPKSDARVLVADVATGRLTDSLVFTTETGLRKSWRLIDSSTADTIIAFLTDQDTLYVCDPSLRTTGKVSYPGGLSLRAFVRLVPGTPPQILASGEDHRVWLLRRDLTPLGRLDEPIQCPEVQCLPETDRGETKALILTAEHHRTVLGVTLVRTPWTAVFSRHPILAFAAAFIPMLLILIGGGVVYEQRRRKNKIIERQKDELDRALTELHDAQTRLIEAEKTRLTRDIAGGVAHEIRNALDPAIHSLALLRNQFGAVPDNPPEKLARLFDLTEKAIRRAVAMSRSVRDFASLEGSAGNMAADVGGTVEGAIALHQERIDRLGVTLEVKVPRRLDAQTSPEHLEIILGNLVSNALDAMESSPERRLRIAAEASGDRMRIMVHDTGAGIPADQRGRIFNAFYSTKPDKGMGLGLTFAKRIAEVNGGSLALLDQNDRGATFQLELPAGHPTQKAETKA